MAQLRTGQPAELAVEGMASPMPATIQLALCDEAMLSVVPPPEERDKLRAGVRVQVRFNSPAGRHEGGSTILRVKPGAGGAMEVAIGVVEGVRTSQRRQYFRVSAGLSIEVAHISQEGVLGKVDKRAFTLDISAGGVRFETVLQLVPEQKIRIVMRPPPDLQTRPNEMMLVEARVVRVERYTRRNVEMMRAAAEFFFRRESERDRWVLLTLMLQRQPRPE